MEFVGPFTALGSFLPLRLRIMTNFPNELEIPSQGENKPARDEATSVGTLEWELEKDLMIYFRPKVRNVQRKGIRR